MTPGLWIFTLGWITLWLRSSTNQWGTLPQCESLSSLACEAEPLTKNHRYSVYRRVVDYYSDDMDAFDMRKSLRRDVDNKHVRENGEDFKVSPNDVW